MSILYKYHLLGRLDLDIKRVVVINESNIISELSVPQYDQAIMGNRMGVFPNYPTGDIELILTSSLNKLSSHPHYIRIDAGLSFFKIYNRLFSSNIYLPLSYPPNPYESIGGLFIQGLLLPIYPVSLDELLYKIVYYDFKKREIKAIYRDFSRLIGRRDILLLRFYFKKFVISPKDKISLIVGVRKEVDFNKLMDIYPNCYDLSIIKTPKSTYLISMALCREVASIRKNVFKRLGCRVKLIELGKTGVYPSILYSLPLSTPKKICMYKTREFPEDMIYYNYSSGITISIYNYNYNKVSNCILETKLKEGGFCSEWRL